MNEGAMKPIREEPGVALSRWHLHAERSVAAQGDRKLCCVSVNVQTLDPAEQRKLRHVGLRVNTRMAFIDDYLHARGAKLVGVQEARLAESGCLDLPNYYAYCSPATAEGQGGVQCWVHKSLKASIIKAACHPRSSHILRC